MTSYRVIWEIEIDAESPKAAAMKALDIQRAREKRRQWADLGFGDPTVFKVKEVSTIEEDEDYTYEEKDDYIIIDLGKVK